MDPGHRRRPHRAAEAGLRKLTAPAGRAGRHPGAMAQLVAHLLCKQGVRGSSPLGSTAGQRPFPLGGKGLVASPSSPRVAGRAGRDKVPSLAASGLEKQPITLAASEIGRGHGASEVAR